MDARRLNEIANDPDVRPTLGGDGELDLSPLVADVRNFAYLEQHGAIVCLALGSGVYDIHSMFRPAGRGLAALQVMRDVADALFSTTDCVEARTTVPEDNASAAVMARKVGFKPLFSTRVPWTGGQRVPADVFGWSLLGWALSSPAALELGGCFHDLLEDAKLDAGSVLEAHDDDEIHDRVVGAVGLMAMAGNGEKAIRFYNLWAQSAGYRPVELLQSRPIVVDLHDAIVQVDAHGMKVLTCR